MVGSNSAKTNAKASSQRQDFFQAIGFLLFLLGMAFYGITLIALASVVTIGSIAVGVFLILRSYESGDTKFKEVSGAIEQMCNDASFDISEELIAWEELKYSQGLGTKLSGQMGDIEDINRRLLNTHDELARATTPIHRIEAVLAADSILPIARELRAPAQS